MNLKVPFCKKQLFQTAPCYTIPTAWNALSTETKKIMRLNPFKNKLRKNIFERYRSEPECTRDGCFSCSGSSRRSWGFRRSVWIRGSLHVIACELNVCLASRGVLGLLSSLDGPSAHVFSYKSQCPLNLLFPYLVKMLHWCQIMIFKCTHYPFPSCPMSL